jgi:hypothetical protein
VVAVVVPIQVPQLHQAAQAVAEQVDIQALL